MIYNLWFGQARAQQTVDGRPVKSYHRRVTPKRLIILAREAPGKNAAEYRVDERGNITVTNAEDIGNLEALGWPQYIGKGTAPVQREELLFRLNPLHPDPYRPLTEQEWRAVAPISGGVNFVYNTGKLRMWAGAAGEIDLINDAAVKVMALQDDTGEEKDDEFIGDVITAGAVEVTSTGYTGGFGGGGRIALSSKSLTVDLANDRAEFDCANVTWTSISQAGSEQWVGLLIVKEITSDALSPVIAHIDTATGLPLTPNGSDITLTIDAEGLLQVTD